MDPHLQTTLQSGADRSADPALSGARACGLHFGRDCVPRGSLDHRPLFEKTRATTLGGTDRPAVHRALPPSKGQGMSVLAGSLCVAPLFRVVSPLQFQT